MAYWASLSRVCGVYVYGSKFSFVLETKLWLVEAPFVSSHAARTLVVGAPRFSLPLCLSVWRRNRGSWCLRLVLHQKRVVGPCGHHKRAGPYNANSSLERKRCMFAHAHTRRVGCAWGARARGESRISHCYEICATINSMLAAKSLVLCGLLCLFRNRMKLPPSTPLAEASTLATCLFTTSYSRSGKIKLRSWGVRKGGLRETQDSISTRSWVVRRPLQSRPSARDAFTSRLSMAHGYSLACPSTPTTAVVEVLAGRVDMLVTVGMGGGQS